MATELHTFTGNEVIATELPELLNQNFDYVSENSLKSVNGVEKDENNNVDVTFLTSQVIPTNSDLNNFRESGEYTRELDTIVVANSPTEKPFFLTVLASENLVKQVVTEIDRKDPMTFTRTLSGANWSPWVEGGVDIGIWKSEETVKVGDVRFLKGRENAGYILECVTAGTTGENQPVISEEDVENAEGLDLDDLNGVVPIEKGGTNATTASEACANIGALPLSGGVMTGVIQAPRQASPGIIRNSTVNGVTAICGGTTFNNGATLSLKGIDNHDIDGEEGCFFVKATDGDTDFWLAGMPSGLYWNEHIVLTSGANSIGSATIHKPSYIIETYRDGYNWYRVYSDGWVEQGGRCALNSTWTTQTFLKAFAYTDYTIIAQPINAIGTGGFASPVSIARRSTTQFDSLFLDGQASWFGSWYACGLGVI